MIEIYSNATWGSGGLFIRNLPCFWGRNWEGHVQCILPVGRGGALVGKRQVVAMAMVGRCGKWMNMDVLEWDSDISWYIHSKATWWKTWWTMGVLGIPICRQTRMFWSKCLVVDSWEGKNVGAPACLRGGESLWQRYQKPQKIRCRNCASMRTHLTVFYLSAYWSAFRTRSNHLIWVVHPLLTTWFF